MTGCDNLKFPTLNFPALQVLDLAQCRMLKSVVLDCPVLDSVNLSQCFALRDGSTDQISLGCPNLVSDIEIKSH